jgi:zinc transport system substrate-binding protein
MLPLRPLLAVLVALAAAATLAGCAASAKAAARAQGQLLVVTSVYPLQFVAERVGGRLVDVVDLARPGAEPHELELKPRDVAAVEDADLVVYLGGFQPAVDKAVASSARGHELDVAPAARLDLAAAAEPVSPGAPRAGATSSTDPHFWLDPTRLADVADAVARRLGQVAPADAGAFTASATALRHELLNLDGELRAGLRSCRSRSLVTGHEAFGYLARRYGLQQLGVTGLDPEAEPDAADLAAVAEFVRREKVLTVYTETLASPDVARALAEETGVRTAVLDPVETRPGTGDYLTALRADLVTLRQGQGCS